MKAEKRARKPRENGYIIWENDEIVAIATGFDSKSSNSKTQDMIQTYFLLKDVHPVEAVAQGLDKRVCFDCPFSGGNGCYVEVGKAPVSMWRKYRRGGYHYLIDLSLVRGRKFRFGSYGEPVLLPIELVRTIAAASEGWTGYTHQWRNVANLKYRDYFRASTSDVDDQLAQSWGWKTFCVSDRREGSILCPASHEAIELASKRHAWNSLYGSSKQWKQANCADCGMCSGLLRKTPRGVVANVAPNVFIPAHSNKGKKARKAIAKQAAYAAAA